MYIATYERNTRARTYNRLRFIRQRPLTIAEIIKLEPRIKAILDSARYDTRKNRDLAYSDYKRQLSGLVGWRAEREALATNEVYEITTAALCEALKI